ncbi:DUF4468 domain-containing protein [Sphingobacterium sp.]|uniref:DUF4468 domain-containing protein n=1 Tax=Sphingobacterium sp. TaxID=341027 RepID=UPI0028A1729D|nr:DUF4468 domain-containing protein [Sphingobacterium sp.]
MKSIITTVLLFFCYNVFSQDLPLKDDKVVYEQIIEADSLTKIQLFGASKQFVAKAFKNAKQVIQAEDSNTGLLIGKGITYIKEPSSIGMLYDRRSVFAGRVGFTMQFDNKDGKCRVRIFDIHTDNSGNLYLDDLRVEDVLFKMAKDANSSTGKRKEKKKKLFDESVILLNNEFYGLINTFKESLNTYKSDDNW